ncbi:hypothetical protein PC114_g27899 [Phytophthora cactorum]|nr:hypothetical protein PC114_g27899 [Phytophthora cactorum]
MITLYCAVVGVAGSAFPVDIDENKSVGHLKDAIKEKKMYQFPADELQLFLAKKGDGAWLNGDDLNTMVQSGFDPSLYKMNPLWKLNKPELFGPGVLLGEETVFSITAFIRSSRNSRRLTKLVIGSNFRRCYR